MQQRNRAGISCRTPATVYHTMIGQLGRTVTKGEEAFVTRRQAPLKSPEVPPMNPRVRVIGEQALRRLHLHKLQTAGQRITHHFRPTSKRKCGVVIYRLVM